VDGPESSGNEIRWPFTQVTLLDRVAAVLGSPKRESDSAEPVPTPENAGTSFR
jgi:hypothetical protein